MATGRPREFDYETALDAAIETFWQKGYDGCSLSDLEEAMGINRPSLYAAFGSKEELFYSAVDQYIEKTGMRLLSSWKLGAEFQSGFLNFLYEAVSGLFVHGKAKGCLVASVLAEESCDSAKARAKLMKCLKRMDEAIVERIEKSPPGCLKKGIDTTSIAQTINAFLHGLSSRARSGESASQLRALARFFHKTMSNIACSAACLKNHNSRQL
jgi:AcrR family transcriptional regulator